MVLFNIFSGDTPVGCPEHNNRPLEFYDKDDGQPVCSHCVVIGDRQTHAIVPIDDVVSTYTLHISRGLFKELGLTRL